MSFTLHADLARDGIAVGDFKISRLLMINDSAYPWFVLVPRIMGVKDAYELSEADHMQVTKESRALCTALMSAFDGIKMPPAKMNVAALGNMTPQLHIHHIVRFKTDPAWPGPIWGAGALTPMSDDEISKRISKVKTALGGALQ